MRIAQWPQPIVVLLTGRIEQAERVRLAADHHGHGIIIENGRNILARKFVGGVRDEQAGFTDGTAIVCVQDREVRRDKISRKYFEPARSNRYTRGLLAGHTRPLVTGIF